MDHNNNELIQPSEIAYLLLEWQDHTSPSSKDEHTNTLQFNSMPSPPSKTFMYIKSSVGADMAEDV